MISLNRISIPMAYRVSIITILGLAVRLAIPLSSPFPLNDGGLFYVMISDIKLHHFALPYLIDYNGQFIPFAYPPLAFYFYAALSTLGRFSELDLVRLLPGIVSTLTVPAFFWFCRELLESEPAALLSTLVFALAPRTIDWLVMGGGVTRSLGLLMAILAMRQSYILFKTDDIKAILPMIGLGALVAYTHPEAATHTLLAGILFFLWKSRSRRGAILAAMCAGGILLLTAPWWLTIVNRFGISPFVAAANAAAQNSNDILVRILALFRFEFTDEPFLAVFNLLGLIGFFLLMAQRKFFLPVWFLSMQLIEPRGGSLFMMLPLAMGAGIALNQLILPKLKTRSDGEASYAVADANTAQSWPHPLMGLSGPALAFLSFLMLYGTFAAYYVTLRIKQEFTLDAEDLRAIQWVKDNSAETSRFALVTGQLPLRDAMSEWFPALTERRSVATVFGFEWVNDGNFDNHVQDYQALQSCASQGPDCLQTWAATADQTFSYLLVRAPEGTAIQDIPLVIRLSAETTRYSLVYHSKTIDIFKRR